MPPDEPTGEEELEELPEDDETPFRPAAEDDVSIADEDQNVERPRLDDTHPATDTNMAAEEWYDEGISGAAEAEEPNPDDAVTGWRPPKPPK